MNEKHTARVPAALIVLDGWGLCEGCPHNAIEAAHTPVMDALWETCPHAAFDASGACVGLPPGQMGNSEIGHMAIGAGAPIDTDLVRINKAISSGTFAHTEAFVHIFSHVRAHDSTLHVAGLLSPGGIHSHSAHIYALLHAAVDAGCTDIVVHAFLDGRDTAPQSAGTYLDELEAACTILGNVRVGSIAGRYYAMDRDNNWDRVARVEAALFEGRADEAAHTGTPSAAIRTLYTQGIYDEHVKPVVFAPPHGRSNTIKPGDGIIFMNFRADRARMLAQRLTVRGNDEDMAVVTLTEYDSTIPCAVAFPPFRPATTLAAELSRAGLTQVHIAETEKYAHATYFLNGGREEPHDGEEHVLIPSRKDVRTHDEAPEMRAREIADAAVERISNGVDFVFINFANADMVGHTANVPAIHAAVEAVDHAVGRVLEALRARGGFAFITADHGNAERNIDHESGVPHTAHTTNPVPAILTDSSHTLDEGTLPDIAPTMLQLLGLPIPTSMTGTVRAKKRV